MNVTKVLNDKIVALKKSIADSPYTVEEAETASELSKKLFDVVMNSASEAETKEAVANYESYTTDAISLSNDMSELAMLEKTFAEHVEKPFTVVTTRYVMTDAAN